MPGVPPSGAWRAEGAYSGSHGGMKKLFVVLLLLLAYLQFRLWFGDGSLPEVWQLHQEVELLREDNVRLRERNDALDAEVRDLQQGSDAIEERAREDLGMIREGETFYQVVE
jgi:cell division protein FtsB